MSNDKPIIFCGAMVRAIIEGRKTQTRRVVKPQPERVSVPEEGFVQCTDRNIVYGRQRIMVGGHGFEPEVDVIEQAFPNDDSPMRCPYGPVGTRLWVREATWIWCEKRPNGKTKTGRNKFRYVPIAPYVAYCADSTKPMHPADAHPDRCWKYKAARFMPRWASRLTLEVTDIRAQRVQEISEEDARAEGAVLVWHEGYGKQGIGDFTRLWDSINAPRGFGWQVNPWVWVLEFRRAK